MNIKPVLFLVINSALAYISRIDHKRHKLIDNFYLYNNNDRQGRSYYHSDSESPYYVHDISFYQNHHPSLINISAESGVADAEDNKTDSTLNGGFLPAPVFSPLQSLGYRFKERGKAKRTNNTEISNMQDSKLKYLRGKGLKSVTAAINMCLSVISGLATFIPLLLIPLAVGLIASVLLVLAAPIPVITIGRRSIIKKQKQNELQERINKLISSLSDLPELTADNKLI